MPEGNYRVTVTLGDDAVRRFNGGTYHLEYGSYLQAKCIVLGIKQARLPLAKYIVDDFGDIDPRHPEPMPANFKVPADAVEGGSSGRRGGRPVGAPGAAPTARTAPVTGNAGQTPAALSGGP